MTNQKLQDYLLSEIKQVISENNLNISNADVLNLLLQIQDKLDNNIPTESKEDNQDLKENFSIVPAVVDEITVEKVNSDIKEVKKLSEEIQRMKLLMNFSSPLLKD